MLKTEPDKAFGPQEFLHRFLGGGYTTQYNGAAGADSVPTGFA